MAPSMDDSAAGGKNPAQAAGLGPLGRLFRRDPTPVAARRLYARVVEQARRPWFYETGGVPDTLDGRFETIALHAFLLLRRLKRESVRAAAHGSGLRPARGQAVSRAVIETMFADMDASLREMGVGDQGVGPRVQRMAAGFYGRIAAYETGLSGSDPALAAALRRNLYGTVEPDPAAIAAVCAYVRAAAARLSGQPFAGLRTGVVEFGDPGATD